MLIRWKSKDKNSNSSSSKKKRKGREGGMNISKELFFSLMNFECERVPYL